MVVERHRSLTVLALDGELDLAAVTALRRDADRALAATSGPIVLDLAGVTGTDLPTLRVMLQAADRCAAHGRPLVLLQPAPAVRVLLQHGALGSTVPVVENLEDALTVALAPRPAAALAALAG
jgi:anti-anti-sigma factor